MGDSFSGHVAFSSATSFARTEGVVEDMEEIYTHRITGGIRPRNEKRLRLVGDNISPQKSMMAERTYLLQQRLPRRPLPIVRQ